MGALSESVDAWWGEELPQESWPINNSLCVIHDLSLTTGGEQDKRGRGEGGAEKEGHRQG